MKLNYVLAALLLLVLNACKKNDTNELLSVPRTAVAKSFVSGPYENGFLSPMKAGSDTAPVIFTFMITALIHCD